MKEALEITDDLKLLNEFGEFLRSKRKAMGLNQEEMGCLLGGYAQNTISMWELGITSPPIADAVEIIKFLGGILLIIDYKDAKRGAKEIW